MNIYYQGYDITNMVTTRKCIVRDTAGERCDSLELEFENASGWYQWGPQEDDQIVVTHGGYDSGVMFLNTILPEDGKYRMLASSLPCTARKKEYRSYAEKTIEEIVRECAVLSGMGYQLYGVDGDIVIPYIIRDNEGCGAFLSNLMALESAALKVVNGKYVAIAYDYDQSAQQTIRLMGDQRGARYERSNKRIRALTVKSPYASATATDTAVDETHDSIVKNMPVLTSMQAGRWARGKLLAINRKDERLTINTEFNCGHTAMIRMDVTGDTDATGEWLIDSVEHDLKNETTRTTLRRCIDTIE